MDYMIAEIHSKDRIIKDIHKTMLNRPCKILALKEDERGWLLVDVGDTEFGPHRICISTVQHIIGRDRDSELEIETENTRYILKTRALNGMEEKSIGLDFNNLSG